MSFGSERSSVPIMAVLKQRMQRYGTSPIGERHRAKLLAERLKREQGTAKFLIGMGVVAVMAIYGTIAVKMTSLAFSDPIALPRYQLTEIYGGRANIVDRNDEIMATNLPGYSLYVHPQDLIEPDRAARELAKIFPDLNEESLRETFHNPDAKFRWLKPQITPRQKQLVFNLGEPGLQFGKREVRLFPNGDVASHLLGGVNIGEKSTRAAEMRGAAGVEFAFDQFLKEPRNENRNLKLSIDLAAQYALEHQLYQGMIANNAKGATGIIMESDTGRIISMASLPDFDPNTRPKVFNGDQGLDPRFNRATQGVYELGSTFKVFTAAQVLEEGIAEPGTYIHIGHSIKFGKYKISDFHFYGEDLTLEDIIVKSSNLGTARLARGLGAEKQKAFLSSLGFMEPTQLELSEARSAQPLYPERWSELSTMTISYGHGIAATPLHLAAGYAAMVNGGFKVEPTILHELPENPQRERVISSKTSMQIRSMLRQVVQRGTASFAKTNGYDIGGKTGTADKLKPSGGYYTNRNVNTFAAAFPISDPKYVVVVVLDEPNVPDVKKRTAGWTVVPVARDIVKRVAPILGVRPVYKPDAKLVPKVKNEISY